MIYSVYTDTVYFSMFFIIFDEPPLAQTSMFESPPKTEQVHSPFTDLIDLLHRQGSNTPSRTKVLETKQGMLLVRDFCPPSLIERLRAESGLCAFARLPEREHQLLLDIANSPDCALTIAHTPTGKIVGQVTIAPLDDWWEGIENAYEVAIEVSSHWRGVGLARQVLAFALEVEAVEDIILVALGLSWHWDLQGLGISVFHYRQMIARLFASQGFQEYETTEPDISMEFGNILLVRIGKNVEKHVADQFREYVMHAPNLVKR
jgi:GNAT superfamily N-acetyltransferase